MTVRPKAKANFVGPLGRLLAIVLLILSVLLLAKLRWIEDAEHWSADWRTALLSQHGPSQHPQVALVVISEETIQDLPVRIPIDRGLLAKVIRAIASAHPAVIGIDFIFARPTTPANDTSLVEAIRDVDVPIVLAAVDQRIALPQRQMDYHKQFLIDVKRPAGHVLFERRTNLFSVSDQVVREIAEPSNAGPRSFAELLAQFKRKGAAPHVRRIDWLLPPSDGSQTFYEVEAQDLLDPSLGAMLLKGLKDKVVLLGADLVDVDRHLTPLSVVDEQRTAGVNIHAQITAQLIDDRWVRPLTELEQFVFLSAIAGIGFFAGRRAIVRRFRKIVAIAGAAIVIGAGFIGFRLFELVLPYTTALTIWPLSVALDDQIEKSLKTFRTYKRFVSIHGGLRWHMVRALGFTLASRFLRERH